MRDKTGYRHSRIRSLAGLAGWSAPVCLIASIVFSSAASLAAPTRAPSVLEQGRVPVYFVANRGQMGDARVRYLEAGAHHASYFVPDGVYETIDTRSDSGQRRRSLIHLRLLDANPRPRIEPEDRLAARINYYRAGRSPHSVVPAYRRLRYRSVYAGIDLLFHGRQGRLEYDFVVAPGGDPGRIRLKVEYARSLRVDPAGRLHIALDGGEIVQQRPVVYQEIDGRRVDIVARYRLESAGDDAVKTFGFEVAPHDPGHPLIIDPVIVSSSFLGGGDDDIADGVAVDAAGNVYVAGSTWSSDFPTLQAIKTVNEPNYTDAFVSKFDASGALVFSTYIGGSNHDRARAIAVDSAGNSYIVGQTSSSDFPLSAQPYLAIGDPYFEDVFVTELDAAGRLVYSTYLGGSSDDYGNDIVVDESGGSVAVYVTGETWSHNFPISHPLYTVLNTGNNGDAFIARLDPGLAGAAGLVWSTYLGGSQRDAGNGIAVDPSGNVYVTGSTESSDFPETANAYPSHFVMGHSRVFVARIDATGRVLEYSGCVGGSADDVGQAIAVDAQGVASVTGWTRSLDFPTVQPLFTVADTGDNQDAFVFSLATRSSGAAALRYSTYLGGSGPDYARDIAIDASGNAYVTGMTWSTDFPVTGQPAPPLATPHGDKEAFVAKIGANGTALVYSVFLGGGNEDQGRALALGPGGDVYIVGQTRSLDFPTISATQSLLRNGNRSGFLSRLR